MSNRKYAAALLQNDETTIEQKMESACTILAEYMNVAAANIIENTPLESVGETKSFQTYLDMKYKDMFPELYRDYEVIIGTVPEPPKWKLVVGWRRRMYTWRDAPYYSPSPFGTSENIQGIRHTATNFVHEYLGDWGLNDEDRVTDTITFDEPTPARPLGGPDETRRIIQHIREHMEVEALDTINNGATYETLRAHLNDTLRNYRGLGEIVDYQMGDITIDGNQVNVDFTIQPHQMLQTVNIDLNLRP
jgi:hypothetical protein